MAMNKIPTISDLFDLSEFEHRKIFENLEYPWDVLKAGFKKKYIKSIIKANVEKIEREGTFVSKTTVIYDDEVIVDDIRIERASATKGELKIYRGGKLLEGASLICAGAYMEGNDIQIGKGCIVEEGAFIGGSNIIGDNNELRNGTYVRGEVITGKRCILGHASEIKSSIFLNDAKAPHFAYVGDSVLGNKVNLGAGTKVSNLKIYGNEIVIRQTPMTFGLKGGIKTGLRKFGALIGDNTETGCNSVLNPGTIFGKNCLIYPGCSPKQQIFLEKSLIKSNEKIIILK